MVTTLPTENKVMRSTDGKVRFYSKRENHIVWKPEEEMTDEERTWAKLPPREGNGLFQDEIEFCQSMANDARDRVRYAQGTDRMRIQNEVIQWELAESNYREASLIPEGEDVTFGYAPHYRGHFPLPPDKWVAPGYAPEPITFPYHTYRTTDPVRIAWLRRHIREKTNANLCELSADPELLDKYGKAGVHRLDAAISLETGRLIDWLPYETVNRMRDNGAAKGVSYTPAQRAEGLKHE